MAEDNCCFYTREVYDEDRKKSVLMLGDLVCVFKSWSLEVLFQSKSLAKLALRVKRDGGFANTWDHFEWLSFSFERFLSRKRA